MHAKARIYTAKIAEKARIINCKGACVLTDRGGPRTLPPYAAPPCRCEPHGSIPTSSRKPRLHRSRDNICRDRIPHRLCRSTSIRFRVPVFQNRYRPNHRLRTPLCNPHSLNIRPWVRFFLCTGRCIEVCKTVYRRSGFLCNTPLGTVFDSDNRHMRFDIYG